MSSARRIREATGIDLTPTISRLAPWGLEEEGGLALEAWLAATGAPGLYASVLATVDPARVWRFVTLLAVSRPVAAILKQNPEFASLLFEGTDEPDVADLRGAIVAEGRLLLASAISPSHRLDRLRWLRQKWSLLLAGLAPAEDAWRKESDVADATIALAREVAWDDLRPAPEGECPVLVVGFGKLGGRELNRSSDIDLVYVLPDDLSERGKRDAARWAEAFGRAMETPMGRGSLYRVDLRLRPFGRSGDLVRSIRGVESYYRNYAEAWEIQALLRSRPIAGPEELAVRWIELREATLRRTIWSPERIEELVEQRERTERAADPHDLKRASGGIRDVEWIAQIGTLLAFEGEAPSTTEAMLSRLADRGALTRDEAESLAADYVLLRRHEDAVQLRDGRQSHLWPEAPEERRALSLALDAKPDANGTGLDAARTRVATFYDERLRDRSRVASPAIDREMLAYVARFDASGAYLLSLRENEGSATRLSEALALAPRLMAELRDSEVLEELLSGEFVEDHLDISASDAAAFRRAHARLWLRYALTGQGPMFVLPFHLVERVFEGSGLFVLMLGSIATDSHGPWSDLDLLLLHDDELSSSDAEIVARGRLDVLRRFQREGAPGAFDLRLRPDGGKGALVRSVQAFVRYAQEGMAPWERLALGNATHAVAGAATDSKSVALFDVFREIAARPLTDADRDDLFAIKDRVERERSRGEEDLKLGPGGLMDAEWCVRMSEMERGIFWPAPLVIRGDDVGIMHEIETVEMARRRADLGAPEPDPEALREARARIRARLLALRG